METEASCLQEQVN